MCTPLTAPQESWGGQRPPKSHGVVPDTQASRLHPSDVHQSVTGWSLAPRHHFHTPLMATKELRGGPWHPGIMSTPL